MEKRRGAREKGGTIAKKRRPEIHSLNHELAPKKKKKKVRATPKERGGSPMLLVGLKSQQKKELL